MGNCGSTSASAARICPLRLAVGPLVRITHLGGNQGWGRSWKQLAVVLGGVGALRASPPVGPNPGGPNGKNAFFVWVAGNKKVFFSQPAPPLFSAQVGD